jgi:hypothetical protein
MRKKVQKASPPSLPASPSRSVVRADKAQTAVLSAPAKLEQVLIVGDLAALTSDERVDYYKRVCDSLGLNPLTRPFEYILFKEYGSGVPAKLSLYARKDCTEQLRRIHRVSVVPPLRKSIDKDYVMVEADLRSADGKTDTATGVVPLFKFKDGKRVNAEGVEYANCIMRAETKSKRRGTLSICGLGMLDESELDGVQVVGGVTRDGRIWHTEGYQESLRNGSHEAARRVLAEKLTAHEKGAPVQPESQDEPSEQGAGMPESAPPPAMGEPHSAKWQITLDWACETSPTVMGDAEALEVLKDALNLTWGEDQFWHLAPRQAERLRVMAREFPFQLKEVMPDQTKDEQPPKQAHKRPVPEGTPGRPLTVKGTIVRVNHILTKASGKRMAYIAIQTSTGKVEYGCFDKDITAELEAHKGHEGEVLIADNGQYRNIVGLVKLGAQEYMDGKVKVVQRKDQQAGGSLF